MVANGYTDFCTISWHLLVTRKNTLSKLQGAFSAQGVQAHIDPYKITGKE